MTNEDIITKLHAQCETCQNHKYQFNTHWCHGDKKIKRIAANDIKIIAPCCNYVPNTCSNA